MSLRLRTRRRSTFQKFIFDDDVECSYFKQLHFFCKYFIKPSRTAKWSLSGFHVNNRGCILQAWVIVCSSSSYVIEQYKYLVCDFAEISENELCLKKLKLLASLRNILLNGQFAREMQTLIWGKLMLL